MRVVVKAGGVLVELGGMPMWYAWRAAPDGTKPALVPNFTLILSADPVDPPDPATNDPATNATSLHAETADGAKEPAP